MPLSIKAGVKLEGISPEMAIAVIIVNECFNGVNHDWLSLADGETPTVITSGLDGVHMKGSFHYMGKALDFRTRTVIASYLPQLVETIRKRLGPEYDVVLETDHIHIEFDPK